MTIEPGPLGIFELAGIGPTLLVLDAVAKAADIMVLQLELNDTGGVCMKLRAASTAALQAAGERAREVAEQTAITCVIDLIPSPDPNTWQAALARPETSPLLAQRVVYNVLDPKESLMAAEAPFAIGLIETQGFTAVIEAIDTACKAANVEVVGREKLGGGYIAIVIKGDVAAVRAAIDAGKTRTEGLGRLVAAHVIARPSDAILSLLPKA